MKSHRTPNHAAVASRRHEVRDAAHDHESADHERRVQQAEHLDELAPVVVGDVAHDRSDRDIALAPW